MSDSAKGGDECLTIKSDTRQHLQFLRCFLRIASLSMELEEYVWDSPVSASLFLVLVSVFWGQPGHKLLKWMIP